MKKRNWIKLLVLMFFTGVFLFVYSIYQIGVPEALNKIKLGNYALSFSKNNFESVSSGFLKNEFFYIKNYKVGSIDQIEIETISDDIEFAYIEGDEIILEYYGHYGGVGNLKAPEMDVQEKSNRLIVDVKHDSGIVIFSEFKSTLNLLIPKGFKGSLNIRTTSGDLHLSEAILESLIWETTSGDFIHETLSVNRLEGDTILSERKDLVIDSTDLSTTSGDIELYGALGKINIDTTSGDIYLEGSILKGNVYIDTVSGDVELNGGYGPCLLEYKTISGTRSVTAKNMKILKEEKGHFKAEVGNGDRVINVSTTSGDFIFR